MFIIKRRCSSFGLRIRKNLKVKCEILSPAIRSYTSTIQVDDPELLYHYAGGRWLWDESAQLSRRYKKFDIAALRKVGASSAGSSSCIKVVKYPDENFNKALSLQMNDNTEVVAKVPNANAGRPYFTTESEVATMDFARNVLDIPVLKVLAWCSDANNSPVGAEYIIMEKVKGRPLSEVWETMKGREKGAIIRSIVNMDSRVSGSEVLQQKVPRGFVVGPTTGRATFDDLMKEVYADHGPWRTAEDFFIAIANREKACIERFNKSPRPKGIYDAPGLYRPSPAAKLSVISQYLAITPALLSTKNLDLSSIMWHPDLHSDNIFVDSNEPSRITGIIDWQPVNLSPLFLQARHPSFVDMSGPVAEGLVAPELPDNFDDLNSDEQLAAKKLKVAQTLFKTYEIDMFQKAPNAYKALSNRHTLTNQILGLIGSLFDDGEPVLEGMLISLSDEWDRVMQCSIYEHGKCPLAFSAGERLHQRESQRLWEQSVELMAEVVEEIGVYRGWDGWVSHDEYDDMAQKLATIRESFLVRHAATESGRVLWEKAWPFGIKQTC